MRTGLYLRLRARIGVVSSVVLLSLAAPSRAADCNHNAVEDAADLSAGPFALSVFAYQEVKGLSHALVAADLDGDSDVDLVAGSQWGSIIVFPRKEEGETGPRFRQWSAVSGLPVGSLAAADMEGDGDIDLAAAGDGGTDGKLALLLNRGDASFAPRPVSLPGTPTRSVAAGDLDADGDQDLAAAVPFGVHVFPNIGGGELGEAVRLPVGSDPHAVRAADLDADGLPDIITANFLGNFGHDDNVSVILNGGERGFIPPRNFAAGRGVPSLSVKDLDGDGDLDAAVLNAASGTVTGLINGGKADLSPRELFASERPLLSGRPALVMDDLDQDGAIDMALAGGSLLVLLFQRADAFAGTVHSWFPLSTALAAADVDGDGDPDLAFTDERGLGIVRNDGAGAYEGQRLYLQGGLLRSLAAGDLDSDGHADLAAADSDRGHVSLLLNDGVGSFADPAPRDTGASPVWVALGDLDADGDLDAAAANGSVEGHPLGFRASLLLNDGKGMFAEPVKVSLAALPETVTLARIDADDLDDLVFTGTSDRIDVRLTNRDLTFRAKEARVLGEHPRLLAEDFDGDGDVDLAASTTTRLSLLLNDGDGEFAPPRGLGVGDTSRSIAAADLNGDGLVDFVALGLVPAVLLSMGGGRFDVRESRDLPSRPQLAVRAADLDGDLDVDLVSTTGTAPYVLTVIGNRGDGTFLPPVEVPGLGRLRGLVAADLSGDGLADVAGCERDFVVVLNRTMPPRSRDANGNGVPDECEGAAFLRGDADGSGAIDLTDAVSLLRHLFAGGTGPPCEKSADADDDGRLGVADAVHILRFLFQGGEAPPGPFPACGADPTEDGLSCEVHAPCP